MFRTLWLYRELVISLVKRELKTRYKGSALGFFWSLGRPLFMMAILFIVFGILVPLRFQHAYFFIEGEPELTARAFAAHLMIGILLWNFFATALGESTLSIIANANLIKKVNIPRVVFPVATVLSNLVHLLLAFVVLIPALLLMGFSLSWMALTLPALIILLVVMTAGFAFFLSATNVFYRDVGSMTDLILMAWFYVTPIFYPASLAWMQLNDKPRIFFWIYVANPMATISIGVRRVLFLEGNFTGREVDDATFWKYLLLCVVISALIYGFGRLVFMRLSPRMADEV